MCAGGVLVSSAAHTITSIDVAAPQLTGRPEAFPSIDVERGLRIRISRIILTYYRSRSASACRTLMTTCETNDRRESLNYSRRPDLCLSS